MIKQILATFLLLILVSCTRVDVVATSVVVNTNVTPTGTLVSPSSLPSVPYPTPRIEASCDPFNEDFCIADGHFILQRPIHLPGNTLIDPSYSYGSTANGTREPHHGVEFLNPTGTPVYAAADGIVVFAGPDQEARYSPWGNFYGNLVVLQHDDELFTLYAHLSKIDVKNGQRVFAGDEVAEVGMTGVAIGSHLHFEVRQGNGEDYFATRNPELWLFPAKDATGKLLGTLMISVVDKSHTLIQHAEFTIQYYPEQSQEHTKTYYGTTYAAEMLNTTENAVLGELPAGRYRIAIEANGKVYERWVEVESGKLTQVVFVVK